MMMATDPLVATHGSADVAADVAAVHSAHRATIIAAIVAADAAERAEVSTHSTLVATHVSAVAVVEYPAYVAVHTVQAVAAVPTIAAQLSPSPALYGGLAQLSHTHHSFSAQQLGDSWAVTEVRAVPRVEKYDAKYEVQKYRDQKNTAGRKTISKIGSRVRVDAKEEEEEGPLHVATSLPISGTLSFSEKFNQNVRRWEEGKRLAEGTVAEVQALLAGRCLKPIPI
jgi:hypothetical protein